MSDGKAAVFRMPNLKAQTASEGSNPSTAPSLSSQQNGEAQKRFGINVISNVLWLGISTLVNLWYTPFLIDRLGVAAYGLIPLANSLANYMSMFIGGLQTALGRFLIIDLTKGDYRIANRTFNTGFFGMAMVSGVLIPVAIGFSWATPYMFNVPQASDNDVRWLFLAVLSAFLVTGIGNSFAVSAFTHHRFDLLNVVNVFRLLLRVGFVVVLFSLLTPQLWHVGMGVLISTTLSLAWYVIIWRKLTPELYIATSAFDWSRFKELATMSTWVVVDQIGSLLFLSVDLIVVNTIFGAEAAGRYGAVLLFSILLRLLADAVSGVLTPAIMAKYACQDFEGVARISAQTMKLIGLGVALPIGLLCGFSQPVLGVWLGPSFEDLAMLLVFQLGHLSINLAIQPLFAIARAFNKVRVPAIVTILGGSANLGLAVVLAKFTSWGPVSVALAGAVVFTLRNSLFTNIYSARILKLSWWRFFPGIFSSVVAALLLGFAAYGLTLMYKLNSWAALAGASVLIAGVYAVGVYFIGLNREDRLRLQSFFSWSRLV